MIIMMAMMHVVMTVVRMMITITTVIVMMLKVIPNSVIQYASFYPIFLS